MAIFHDDKQVIGQEKLGPTLCEVSIRHLDLAHESALNERLLAEGVPDYVAQVKIQFPEIAGDKRTLGGALARAQENFTELSGKLEQKGYKIVGGALNFEEHGAAEFIGQRVDGKGLSIAAPSYFVFKAKETPDNTAKTVLAEIKTMEAGKQAAAVAEGAEVTGSWGGEVGKTAPRQPQKKTPSSRRADLDAIARAVEQIRSCSIGKQPGMLTNYVANIMEKRGTIVGRAALRAEVDELFATTLRDDRQAVFEQFVADKTLNRSGWARGKAEGEET